MEILLDTANLETIKKYKPNFIIGVPTYSSAPKYIFVLNGYDFNN